VTIFILFHKLNVEKTNFKENEGFVTFKFYWKNYKYHVSKKIYFIFIHVLRTQIWKYQNDGWCVSRSQIHERTISLRGLGIILRVLRLEVSVYNIYITNLLQKTFAQSEISKEKYS
jgi:hypothetical protein